MSLSRLLLLAVCLLAPVAALPAADKPDLQSLLARPILDHDQTLTETQDYLEPLVPTMKEFKTRAEWEKEADRLRTGVLERAVYRGEAAGWRDAKTRVEWQETIAGGPGYRIKKLRYEALPGLWIPALLYEPEKLSGKVPVVLNVNGHDSVGKAAGYKQIRCINQAKRGMLALNVEWLGMGQLRTDGFSHGRMNQLDLCGSSGLAPYYLAMKRGLDVLLSLENADPERVAVTGLSGGGWQTIFISSLDTRVKLTDPVAGYSSFRTRIRHFKDLGDSEQTPCDLATVADYTHLTAMMAPRATLLTFNAKDDCCFEAGYALPPLVEAALPIFKLYDREKALRTHVNEVPGTHNYEKDNRQALYRMLGDHFYPGDPKYSAEEIPCADEVKSKDALAVTLPPENADFHALAMALSKDLPHDAALPEVKDAALKWQQQRRPRLRQIVQFKTYEVRAEKVGSETSDGLRATFWRLKLDGKWTVPVVELARGEPKKTAVLLVDGGRKSDKATVERLLTDGYRVLAVDPFLFGESAIEKRGWLFALLVAAVGERSLGIQAGQVAAVARWATTEHKDEPVTVVAVGPRCGSMVLVAGALEEKAIAAVELHGAFGSWKEVIEQNATVQTMPEQFCFGLLESFDIKQVAALVAPRPVQFVEPSPRVKTELAGLKAWYATLGTEFEPLR